MKDALLVSMNGQTIGWLRLGKNARTSFTYDETWRRSDGAYPLSLSMPLVSIEHGPEVVEAFLWGLLPDNEAVLERWARKFQISARNVFGLITAVGEDCAGAAQFVDPERANALNKGEEDKIEWLDDAQIANRMRTLREDHAAWRLPRDTGQFSLAGAQPKTAFLYDNGRWGIPHGRIPTTHILKPPTGEFDGHAENEHICLALARALGLSTAASRVVHFEGEVAIVIERYDRYRAGNEIIRVHQEDTCQALGIPPGRKYQNENGPSPEQLVELIRTQSNDAAADVETFVRALAFNWLIAGTDAHAKNYSFLLAEGPRVRLAPLYDIASALPYPKLDRKKLKLAMKVGGEYLIEQIGIRQWKQSAKSLRVDQDRLVETMQTMSDQIPDEVERLRLVSRDEGLKHKLIDQLTKNIAERARRCGELLRLPTEIA